MMQRFIHSVPIGRKIFGLAISMLILLIALSAFTYVRVKDVANELLEISEFLVPLTALLANIDVHALEQEIHLERMLRLYEIAPLNVEHVSRELAGFEKRGGLVDAEIEQATQGVNAALAFVETKHDIIALAALQSVLTGIQKEHQGYHDHALKVMQLFQQGAREEARILEHELEQEEEDLDRELAAALHRLQAFTTRSARTQAAHQRQVLQLSRILVVLAAVVGLTFASVVTVGLMRPVKMLVAGTQEVERGNLDIEVALMSRDEIGELTGIFNTMVQGIKEKERIQATFGQYLDPRIVDNLMQVSGALLEKVDRQVMTVFFSDVVAFSAISEMLTPDGLVHLINQYLTLAAEPITRYNGVIDKFIGDAVLAFWGPPFASATEHAHGACAAALEQFIQLERLRRRMPDLLGIRKGLPAVNIRVGLATGEVIVGNIGTEHSMSYTIMGEPTRIAEQLESLNKTYGTQILMTEATRQLVAETFETRKIDVIRLGSAQQSGPIFELLSPKGELDSDTAEMRGSFEEGLRLYTSQAWDQAQRHFATCLRIKHDDRPATLYGQRVQHLRAHPPGDDWDGVWT